MFKANIGIIDIDMGNMFSVLRACEQVDLTPVLTSNNKSLNIYDALILPGVGAFGEAMKNLKRLDLIYPIKDFIANGKPFMGICLGMQLLFSESEEFGSQKGIGVLGGGVVSLPSKDRRDNVVKVPQVGWNKIICNKEAGGFPILDNVKDGAYMYFVHSYYVVPEKKQNIATLTDYADVNFCSSVVCGNVSAFQFHPEKSAEQGLQIYKNFKNVVLHGRKNRND